MIERRLDIAMPEMSTEAETDRQIENDVEIRAGLAGRRHHRGAKLHQFAGILIEPEADAQPLALPGAGDRQDDVGMGGGRRQVEIALDMKLEAAQRLGAARGIGVRQQQIEPEADQRANPIRLPLDHGAIKIIREDPARLAHTERARRKPERLPPLRCVAQFAPRDVVDRHLS